jgi:hypothetical protein
LQRTREALAVTRASDVRPGRPPTLPQPVVRRIQRQRGRGDSFRKIAAGLKEAQVPTAQGGAHGIRRPSGTFCSGRRDAIGPVPPRASPPPLPPKPAEHTGPIAGVPRCFGRARNGTTRGLGEFRPDLIVETGRRELISNEPTSDHRRRLACDSRRSRVGSTGEWDRQRRADWQPPSGRWRGAAGGLL